MQQETKPCQGDKEYEELKQALTDHFKPANPIEQVLVERIAILDWRLKRSIMAERKSVHTRSGEEYSLPPVGALERILKYERTMDQELHRTISTLEQLRASTGKSNSHGTGAPLPASGRGRGRGLTETCENGTNKPAIPPSHAQNQVNPDFKNESCDFKMKSGDSRMKSPDSIIDTPVEAMLEALFPSAARLKVLGVLLLESPGRFYLRELATKTGLWFRPVQRELANLVSVGIVAKETNGQQAYYSINDHCPLVPELRSIFMKAGT